MMAAAVNDQTALFAVPADSDEAQIAPATLRQELAINED